MVLIDNKKKYEAKFIDSYFYTFSLYQFQHSRCQAYKRMPVRLRPRMHLNWIGPRPGMLPLRNKSTPWLRELKIMLLRQIYFLI